MKWYSTRKYRPCHTGDQVIIRLKDGALKAGIFDHSIDKGYLFDCNEEDYIYIIDVTHFCVPDPIEIEDR